MAHYVYRCEPVSQELHDKALEIQRKIIAAGHTIAIGTIIQAWKNYSNSLEAHWMACPTCTGEDYLRIMRKYIREVETDEKGDPIKTTLFTERMWVEDGEDLEAHDNVKREPFDED